MDKILKIEEVYNFEDRFEGYEIITEKHNIKLLIENSPQCCEDYGYLASSDDFNEFIGAEYLGYEDIEVSSILPNDYVFEGGGSFCVKIKTSNGELTFEVYNNHNGYYGHDIKFIVDDKIVENYNL